MVTLILNHVIIEWPIKVKYCDTINFYKEILSFNTQWYEDSFGERLDSTSVAGCLDYLFYYAQ